MNSIRNSRLEDVDDHHENQINLNLTDLDTTQFESPAVNLRHGHDISSFESPKDASDGAEQISLKQEQLHTQSAPITVDADIMANLLLTNTTDGVLQFDTNDRGAMEL